MDVRNCRKCGRLFNYMTGPLICPRCKDELEERFQDVKNYVYNHPGCGMAEVAEECDVSPQQIRQWLREERLQFSDDSAVGLNCEKCGVMIRSGRYCEKCKNEMTHDFQEAYHRQPAPEPKKKPDPHDNPKMRYLDR